MTTVIALGHSHLDFGPVAPVSFYLPSGSGPRTVTQATVDVRDFGFFNDKPNMRGGFLDPLVLVTGNVTFDFSNTTPSSSFGSNGDWVVSHVTVWHKVSGDWEIYNSPVNIIKRTAYNGWKATITWWTDPVQTGQPAEQLRWACTGTDPGGSLEFYFDFNGDVTVQ